MKHTEWSAHFLPSDPYEWNQPLVAWTRRSISLPIAPRMSSQRVVLHRVIVPALPTKLGNFPRIASTWANVILVSDSMCAYFDVNVPIIGCFRRSTFCTVRFASSWKAASPTMFFALPWGLGFEENSKALQMLMHYSVTNQPLARRRWTIEVSWQYAFPKIMQILLIFRTMVNMKDEDFPRWTCSTTSQNRLYTSII